MSQITTIDELAKTITPVLRKHGIIRASCFGSFARDEATATSDIDLLVDFPPESKMNLWQFIGIKQELEELTGRSVDLLSEGGVAPKFRKKIEPDFITLL